MYWSAVYVDFVEYSLVCSGYWYIIETLVFANFPQSMYQSHLEYQRWLCYVLYVAEKFKNFRLLKNCQISLTDA